jgi:hypothetical protein
MIWTPTFIHLLQNMDRKLLMVSPYYNREFKRLYKCYVVWVLLERLCRGDRENKGALKSWKK